MKVEPGVADALNELGLLAHRANELGMHWQEPGLVVAGLRARGRIIRGLIELRDHGPESERGLRKLARIARRSSQYLRRRIETARPKHQGRRTASP
jgi:hypothetical protein